MQVEFPSTNIASENILPRKKYLGGILMVFSIYNTLLSSMSRDKRNNTKNDFFEHGKIFLQVLLGVREGRRF